MVTALVASSYQTMAAVRPSARIEEIMAELNQVLLRACEERYFMTLTMLEFSPDWDHCEWALAAAPPVFRMASGAREADFFAGSGNPMGSRELAISRGSQSFAEGDKLLVFTDGLVDVATRDGTKLGRRRLRETLEQARSLSAAQCRDRILGLVRDEQLPGTWEDDVTFVVVERT
jgi:serine phosphatase RsbU (regulator of sigma subunit)